MSTVVANAGKKAVIHRMVMPSHTCPYGLKAVDLLKRSGYEVEDHHLTTREETDAFKTEHDVKTTPQVFVDGRRIGGYDDTRRFWVRRGFLPLTELDIWDTDIALILVRPLPPASTDGS